MPDYLKNINKDIKGLKIGLPKEYFTEELDKDIKEVVNNAVEQLKKLGAEIREVSLPYTKYAIST